MSVLHVLNDLGQDSEAILGTATHSLVTEMEETVIVLDNEGPSRTQDSPAGIQFRPYVDPGWLLLLLLGRRRWIRTGLPFHPAVGRDILRGKDDTRLGLPTSIYKFSILISFLTSAGPSPVS